MHSAGHLPGQKGGRGSGRKILSVVLDLPSWWHFCDIKQTGRYTRAGPRKIGDALEGFMSLTGGAWSPK